MGTSILKYSNRFGVPAIESQGVSVTDTAVTFTFNNHPYTRYYYNNNFSGLILVKINDTFTAPATAVPVQFTTSGVANSTRPILTANGTAITSATFAGPGVYVFFYDNEDGRLLQLTTNI